MKINNLKIKFFILIFFSISHNFIIGQNLVPNHSFETITSCPNGLSQIYKSPPWFITANSFNNSPDLFNQCDSSSSVISCGVPQNYFGFQQANSGIGYAGIICYGTNSGQPAREYIQTQLISSLISGERYKIEMYVSPSENYNLAIDKIGIHISNGSISGIGNWLLPFVPQINSSSGNLISDTASWTLISGTYVAGGGEDHITVGNFYDDVNTSIGVIDKELISQSIAYYYIDDISVTHLTLSNDSTWHCYQSAGCQWAGSNPTNPGQFTSLLDCQASCTPTLIDTIDATKNKILIKVVDILGRETSINSNETLFFIYENGTVVKRIILE